MSQPVWVQGQQSPVFGTDRPGTTTNVFIDVADFDTFFFIGGNIGRDANFNNIDHTWTLPAVSITQEARWFVSATIYINYRPTTTDLIVRHAEWSDPGGTTFSPPAADYDKQNFSLVLSTTNFRNPEGDIFTYNAVFDYAAGASASPSFNAKIQSPQSGSIKCVMAAIRGDVGNTLDA